MEALPSERRRWPRLSSHVPVRYQDIATHRYTETLSNNLGGGGVQCVTHEFLPASRELLLEISLYRATPPVKARARVAWIQKVAHADQYRVGLEFLQLPDDLRRTLDAYLDTASKHAALA